MGYLFLAISIFAGTVKGYCSKRTSGYVNEYKDAILANLIRMVFCVLIGAAITIAQSGIGALRINRATLLICCLSGVTSSIFVVSWLLSLKESAYMMLNVFLMLGMLVPLAGSSMLFNESVSLRQFGGILLLIVAAFIMCSYSSSIKGKMTPSAIVLLIICGLSSGASEFSQKLFVEYTSGGSVAVFNFYTYVFSAVVLLALFVILSAKGGDKVNTTDIKYIFGYILVMSICLFAHSYFQTQSAAFLSSAQLFPLSKGVGMIVSALMSALLFKERLNLKAVTGMTLSFVALLIINL